MQKMTLKTGAAVGATALLAAASFGLARAAEPGATAIVGATIFDAKGTAPYVGTVVIKGERIVAVGPKVKAPRGARIVKADGEALLPGFYDVHTHWTPGGMPALTPAIASAYIAVGVTTVDDFHQPPEAFEPRRAWLKQLSTPHVNLTARLSTPGGHGADWADVATTKWVNTPDAARAAIRSLAAYKPDTIKAFTDGWRYGAAPDNTSMDVRTLAALVDEAHKEGLSVLTHTVTAGRDSDAGVAKVDVIAHSAQDRLFTAEEIARIKAGGTAYTGTLALSDPQKRRGAPLDMTNPAVQLRERNRLNAMANIKALYDAGVPIVNGTDAGMPNTPHGYSTLREMELMVDAGIPATAALMAGTINSAVAVRQGADRGTIEVGKRADLVLIKGKPWEKISDIHNTDRVFIDGRIVFGPGSTPNPMNAMKSLPAVKATAPLIDDFERPDGRTALNTLRTDNPDGGLDRSVQVTQIVDRGPGKALDVSARLSVKSDAMAAVVIPLSRGAVTPVDASAFKGLKMDIRGGQGPYRLAVRTLTDRWSVEVPAGADWRAVSVPFTDMARDRAPPEEGGGDAPAAPPAVWTGTDLMAIEVTGQGEAGGKIWYQIDNLAFY